MDQLIIQESWFLLYSVLLGIGITVVYDCIKIFRNVVPHHIFWISVEDFFYWIFVSCSMFYLLYYESNGTLRWFAVVGTLIGMLLMKKTVSPLFIKGMTAVFFWINQKAAALLHFVTKPLRRMKKNLQKQAQIGRHKLARLMGLLKKRLTIRLRMIKMILCKRREKAQRGK